MVKFVTERLGKEAWIDRGLGVLRADGIEAVRVEPVAKALGVTKGSFYWHFRDRAHWLDDILAAWEERATSHVIAVIERESATPDGRLRALVMRTFGRDDGLDRAIRAWATHDTRAHALLAGVDRRRLDYLVAQFVAVGVGAIDAEARARMLCAALIGEQGLAIKSSRDERIASALRVLDVLLRP